MREAVSGLLDGAEIAEAGTFEEGSELLERGGDVDLILLDLTMPGVRGFSGLMYLRAQYPSVPMVVVSANDDPAVIRRCMEFGASGFIPKTLGVEAMRDGDRARAAGRGVDAARCRSHARADAETTATDRAAGHADAAAGPRADDAVGRTAQQADRLRARRIGSDREGACLRHPAEARRREPHPGRHRRRQDRSRPVAAGCRRGKAKPLLRRDALHPPLREQRAKRGRLDRLVQHLDAFGAGLVAHRQRAVGGDQDRRQVAASAGASSAIAAMPLPRSR